MSKNVLIAATAAALAIGFGAYEHRRAGQAEEAAAGIARERDDLLARLRSAPSSGPAIGRTDPAPRKNPDSVNSAPSHPPTIDAAQAANKAAAERTQQEAQRNSGPDNNTRALYRLMNFTPAQIEQFQALVARNNRRQGELVGLMAASPGSAEEIQAMKDRVTAEFTVDLRAAFGDALARQIEQYRETLPLRAVTERLANSLFYTDAPLTASQVEKLIPILAQHARGPDGSIALASLDVEAALPEAQRVLSASQLADLRNVSNQYLAQTRRLRETQERTSRERGAR